MTIDDEIQKYDRSIRDLLPSYDEMMSIGVSILAEVAPKGALILDLGAGTGRASQTILSRVAGARVALLDVRADVLDIARHRLRAFSERATFYEGSYETLMPSADAIVASLSLHFFPDIIAKTKVYRRICDALPPNGLFLSFDLFLSSDLPFRALSLKGYESAVSPGEHYLPLNDELQALRDAGFKDTECFWRCGPLAIIGARRNPAPVTI